MIIKLQKPIQHGSETIQELKFREPKARDIRDRAERLNTNELLTLAQELSAQPKFVIDELSIPDMYKVLEAMGEYLNVGQVIGGKP
jgi:hypothetical protein